MLGAPCRGPTSGQSATLCCQCLYSHRSWQLRPQHVCNFQGPHAHSGLLNMLCAQRAYIRPEWNALLPMPVQTLVRAIMANLESRQDLQLPLTVRRERCLVPLSTLISLDPCQVRLMTSVVLFWYQEQAASITWHPLAPCLRRSLGVGPHGICGPLEVSTTGRKHQLMPRSTPSLQPLIVCHVAQVCTQSLLSSSSVMRRLFWSKNSHQFCRCIMACSDGVWTEMLLT